MVHYVLKCDGAPAPLDSFFLFFFFKNRIYLSHLLLSCNKMSPELAARKRYFVLLMVLSLRKVKGLCGMIFFPVITSDVSQGCVHLKARLGWTHQGPHSFIAGGCSWLVAGRSATCLLVSLQPVVSGYLDFLHDGYSPESKRPRGTGEAGGLLQPGPRSHTVSLHLQSQARPPSGERTEPQLWSRRSGKVTLQGACEVHDAVVAVLRK